MSTGDSKRTRTQNGNNTISRESQSLKDSDIAWFGECWTCNKQLKHYSALSWKGICIEVHSFVWIQNEDRQAEIGYIVDMYEDPQGTKMVRARCFVFAEENKKRRIPGLSTEPKEIYLTHSLHEIHADSIDGVAAVLNLEHFMKCYEFLPATVAYETFVSDWEYKNDGTLCPFVLGEFEGYSKQPIFSCLEHYEREARNLAFRQSIVMALECPQAPGSVAETRRRRRPKKS